MLKFLHETHELLKWTILLLVKIVNFEFEFFQCCFHGVVDQA
jgi:hypothetical protein